MNAINFAALMEPVARHLLGEPNRHLSSKEQLRFGTNGSLSVEIGGEKAGTFYDHEHDVGGGVLDFIAHKIGVVNGNGMAWLAEHGFTPSNDTHPGPRQVETAYDYLDADGQLAFQVVRRHPKKFLQRQPDGAGGWIWNLKGVAPVPYRLPELLEADPSRIVFVPEGEKDVDRLRGLGFLATCNSGGAGKWKAAHAAALRGRRVAVLPDNDEAGEDHAAKVAASLREIAAQVAVLRLPDLGPKGDVSDWLDAGGTGPDLERLLAEALDAAAAEAKPQDARGEKPAGGGDGYDPGLDEEPGGDDGDPSILQALPVIEHAAGLLPEVVDQAEKALLDARAGIYQRGAMLVRPGRVLVSVPHRGEVEALRILEVGAHTLVEEMTKTASWKRYDARARKLVPITAPMQVAETYRQRTGRWEVPVLAGVLNAPTLREDGSILAAEGYDPRSGLLLDLRGVAFPEVLEHPTHDDAGQALQVLKGLVNDFPFVADADRAVALSAMLTAPIRRSLRTAPLHAFSAPTAGSGKSLLVDIASMIATSREAGVIAQGATEEEMEKRLGAQLLAGDQIIAIDNCDEPLGGQILCQMLTQRAVRVRVLGRSETPEMPSNALVTATGNNLVLMGDMTRRSLLCRIDPKEERPELREFAVNPVEMVRADRGKYVHAALTVLRAYHVAGRPPQAKPLGSFEDWSRWVRDALIWVGESDPAETVAQARASDPKLEELTEILRHWKALVGQDNEVTVRVLIDKATVHRTGLAGEPHQFMHPDFREALLRIAGKGGAINGRSLGRWLGANKGRVVDRVSIQSGKLLDGSATWKIVPQPGW